MCKCFCSVFLKWSQKAMIFIYSQRSIPTFNFWFFFSMVFAFLYALPESAISVDESTIWLKPVRSFDKGGSGFDRMQWKLNILFFIFSDPKPLVWPSRYNLRSLFSPLLDLFRSHAHRQSRHQDAHPKSLHYSGLQRVFDRGRRLQPQPPALFRTQIGGTLQRIVGQAKSQIAPKIRPKWEWKWSQCFGLDFWKVCVGHDFVFCGVHCQQFGSKLP